MQKFEWTTFGNHLVILETKNKEKIIFLLLYDSEMKIILGLMNFLSLNQNEAPALEWIQMRTK